MIEVRGTPRALALATLLSVLTCRSAGAAHLAEVVVGLPSNVSLSYAMFTAAMDLGYFSEEGLDVRLQEFQGGAIVMSQVATKSVLIGTGTPDPLAIANQPGRSPLPLKFFYNQTRDYNWEFVVPPASPIRSIADLKGKNIGVSALTNSHIPVSRVILKDSGLVLNKDYRFVALGSGGPAFKALFDGDVAAYITFTSNIARFETSSAGVKLRALPIGPRFSELFQNGFFAHADTIKDNPRLLSGFGRGAAKATIFCRQAMEFCVKSFWKHFPNLKPREGTDDDNARRLAESIRGPWRSYFDFPQGVPPRFGEYPARGWQTLIEVLHEGGELTTTYDPASLYTNSLIARINDFDPKAVETQAQRYLH